MRTTGLTSPSSRVQEPSHLSVSHACWHTNKCMLVNKDANKCMLVNKDASAFDDVTRNVFHCDYHQQQRQMCIKQTAAT
jgi:hypothetical protein